MTSPPGSKKPAITVATAILATLALAGTGVAIVGSMGSTGISTSSASARERTAIVQAGDRIDEAVRWLERRATQGSDELNRLIRENSPEQLLAAASERLADRIGVFEYRPGDAGEQWERFIPENAPDVGRPVVLLVHGLDEPGDIWDELAPALHLDGHRVLRFNYPNDQSPDRSADTLARALEKQVTQAEIKEIAIVAHSMGGLIARDLLTRHAQAGDWHGPKVRHLITVGTPNQGSPVAALQPIGEAREVVARLWTSRSLEPAEVLSFLVDGSGDAAVALAPGSSYLNDLNSRSLPAHTPVTIIAAHATASQRERLDELASSAPLAGLLSEETRELLLDRIDAITDQVGDGVVPLESTPLDGVSDYRVVTANHRSMLRTMPVLSTDPVPPAVPIILEVLRPESEPVSPRDEPATP